MIELHPRLATDTGALGETELCWLRWMRDARFPWLIVVPKRDGSCAGCAGCGTPASPG